MSTQEKHNHCLDTLAGLVKGARIAWTDHNGEAREDEVLSVGTKRITTLLTTVAFNVKDLRVVSTPALATPAAEIEADVAPPAPTPNLRDYHLQRGEWIQWTDEHDQEHTDEVRSTDDAGITTARTRVPWTARNLRLVATDRHAGEAMTRSITSQEIRAEVPLDLIDESPFNPRKTFHADSIASLAANIRDAGLIDPLLLRPKAGGRYELVDGARRRRACQEAGLVVVPVRIREMDDDEALRIMFDTREHREPLNPIDRAEALLKLVQEHGSQRKVAKHLEVDQSAISRATAIARLPERVKEIGRHNELSPSHLERLVKWNDWPEICTKIAELAVARHTSVAELVREPLPFSDVLRQLKLVKEFYLSQVEFDKALLEQREIARVMVKPAQSWGPWYCLEPALYKRLHKEAKDAQKAKDEEARAKALAAAGAASTDELPKLETIKGQWVNRADYGNQTPSCDGECDCARSAWCSRRKQVVQICTSPDKLRALQAADKKAAAKLREQQAHDLLDQVYAELRERGEISTRDLVYAAGRHISGEAYLKAGEILDLDLPQNLGNGDTSALTSLPPIEARNLYVMAAAIQEASGFAKGWHPYHMRGLQAYLGIEPAQENPAHE